MDMFISLYDNNIDMDEDERNIGKCMMKRSTFVLRTVISPVMIKTIIVVIPAALLIIIPIIFINAFILTNFVLNPFNIDNNDILGRALSLILILASFLEMIITIAILSCIPIIGESMDKAMRWAMKE